MKRVIVIGCPGSGKSCFSRILRDKTGLPLYYLDMIWHKKDKTCVSKEEFDVRLSEIVSYEKWIIDGNYSRTLECRLERCDTVILFHLPVEDCLKGAESRIGTQREDLPWLETEFDPEFREFIEKFEEDSMPRINNLIEKYKDKVNLVVFHTREDANKYLENLTQGVENGLSEN